MDKPSEPATRIHRSFFDLSDEMLANFDHLPLWREFGASASCDWDELLKSPRVLLISEAGSGKTYECKAQKQCLWDAGEPAFYLELAQLATNDLDALLATDETTRLARWRIAQSDIATFFLDSIDELALTRGSFRTALNRLARAVDGQLHRVRVVVTARPIAFDQTLIRERLPVPPQPEPAASAEAFADLAMGRHRDTSANTQSKPPPEWRTVALLPLDDAQMRHIARAHGIDNADALLAAIQHDNAGDFAHRPQDLIELCAAWRERGRIGNHREQVESNIVIKLKPRTDRGERTALAPAKAREGAAQLALAALLTRRLSLHHSVEADVDGEPGSAVDPQTILPDWNEDERRTLLERALFSFASYGRVRFHHRSVIEFLAAERLRTLRRGSMSLRAIKRLLFADLAYGPRVVKPTLRPVAAWLTLNDGMDSIFDEVLAREPEVLLHHGDPRSLGIERRVRILRAYVERYGHGGWRGRHVPGLQVQRFAAPDLGDVVQRLWATDVENTEVRELLLDIAAAAPLPGMADHAHSILLDDAAALDERLSALNLLIRVNDGRLDAFTQALTDESVRWPRRLVQSALFVLVPRHIAADRLCDVLSKRGLSATDAGVALSVAFARHGAPTDYLDAIRERLTSLLMTDIAWSQDSHDFVSKRRHLVAPLAVVCQRLIEAGHVSQGLAESSVVAARLVRLGMTDNVHSSALRKTVMDSSVEFRERVFWADDTFCQGFAAEADVQRRLFRIASQEGMIRLNSQSDARWVLAALTDQQRPEDHRALMLEAALDGVLGGPDDWTQRVESLRRHVADNPALSERIAHALMPPTVDPEHERRRLAWEQKGHEREHEEERHHASWRNFWTEVARDPDAAFSADRQGNTIRNLWSVMRRNGKHSLASGWNRRFMEQNFGRDTADRMRVALTCLWRQERPTLRSERPADERNTYLIYWALGVAAIAAEAEDPHWAGRLSTDEAERAARFARIEISGLPSWLDALAIAHPDTVEATLGVELIHELDEPAAKGNFDAMLQHLRRAAPTLASLFLPHLRKWLDANASRLRAGDEIERVVDRLHGVIELLLKFGSGETHEHVLRMASAALDSGCPPEFETIWLPILMRLRPDEGVARLERMVHLIEPQAMGIGAEWIARLFGDRFNEVLVDPRTPGFTPALLLRLVRLAYRHVRRNDDVEHEGTYHPDLRDHAEHGRGALLNALLDRTGADAWAAKLELAHDPDRADFRDRLLILAREKAAEEADAATLSEREVADLDRRHEAVPTTRDDLFALLRDRLDDLEEVLSHDDSPRAGWSRITVEREMRQVIAHELVGMANGMYLVPQESVTADENRTDIRLSVAGHDLEAVIELKIGDQEFYSGRTLRDTIKDQLVAKYLAPEHRRVGCLLVTVAGDRGWRHPDTKACLNIDGLQQMLREEAERCAAALPGELRLDARVLDLRSAKGTKGNGTSSER